MSKDIDYIRTWLSRRDLLEQLAEEAAEVSQAALKVIRAEGYSDNCTPVQPIKAAMDLNEEIHDLVNVLHILGMETQLKTDDYKLKRWAMRLKDKEEFIRRMAENDVD